jgi:hypothetical protein
VAPPRPVAPVRPPPLAEPAPPRPATTDAVAARPDLGGSPIAPPRAEPAPPSGGGGLFGGGLGKWAAWAAPDPAEQLRAHRSAQADHCPGCGRRALRLDGDLRGKLVVLAEPMEGEAAEMFDRMLVRVLTLERTDVLWAEPRECPACVAALSAELSILRPRVVLAMGSPAAAMVGAREPGVWTRLGEVDVLTTYHPQRLIQRPADKRPAFDHLKAVAERI